MRRRRHGQPDPDQALVQQQAVCLPLSLRRRDVVRRTRGAVEQAKEWIVNIRSKTIIHVVCADRPAVLRLMTGEAGTPVSPEIREKGVFCG